MTTREYTIIDPLGMHARPATALLKLGRNFKSAISIGKNGKSVPVKSMLNILALTLKFGDIVTVVIDGEDEPAASAALENFFMEEMKHF
jgi:phosphocarrier protein HPr